MTIQTVFKPACRLLLFCILVISIFPAYPSVSAARQASNTDFIITVKSDNPGTSGYAQFTIPTHGSGINYKVDCNNDGTFEATGLHGDYTCTFQSQGTHTIRISSGSSGTGFPQIFFNGEGDKLKLLSVDQWGTGKWTSMSQAFYGCAHLTLTATDAPDLSLVESMAEMFAYADAFNQPIGNWNVSNVMDMSGMFLATSFNQPIGNWNTSNVKYMDSMFEKASAFNQPIGNWNTSNVTNMSYMFFRDSTFNQAIGGWNTSNVTNMSFMFFQAIAFNQPIGNWNVSKVTDMRGMFLSAPVFNQSIGNWDTSNVTDMESMFQGASTFNQPIGKWNTSKVTTTYRMFEFDSAFNQDLGGWNVESLVYAQYMFDSKLSTAYYDSLLKGWDAHNLHYGVMFDAWFSTYCNAAAARAHMISQYGWVIGDSGYDCPIMINTHLPMTMR